MSKSLIVFVNLCFHFAGWNSLGRWNCFHLTVCYKPRRNLSLQVYSWPGNYISLLSFLNFLLTRHIKLLDIYIMNLMFMYYKNCKIILYEHLIINHHLNYFNMIILKINKFIIYSELWLNDCIKNFMLSI